MSDPSTHHAKTNAPEGDLTTDLATLCSVYYFFIVGRRMPTSKTIAWEDMGTRTRGESDLSWSVSSLVTDLTGLLDTPL